MFEWVLNTPLKIVEYNLEIYLMLLNWKIHVLIDFHYAVFTHDNFLYLKVVRCMFCSDFWETLKIMKSNFDKCKESARKAVKAKISKTLLRIFLKNEQQSHFLNKTSV